jgi:ATP-binding cassette, subfamily F, member 3
MLHITDLTFRIAGRPLFETASATVPQGHKVGLVGRNGTGKTTLFKLISGELHADSGTVSLSGRARVGQVQQEAPGGKTSLIDTVLAADTERQSLLDEAETTQDPHRIGEIHTRLADIEAHAAPARAASILAGLGFDEVTQQQPCDNFSGGWRMRVALAAALFARPDLLLLDEPTNHLDLEAVLWLEQYLAAWQGTLVVISHDRSLLNKVTDEIIHLEHRKLVRYTGNYDQFENTRRERLELDAKMRVKQQAARRHIESFVDRFRAQANKARQAQSRIKMLARMQPIASVMEEKTSTFVFPNPAPLAPPILTLEDTEVGYEENNPVLTNLNLRIDMDDRIALLGANGNGKSTLIKLLSKRLDPSAGTLRKSGKLRVGYFAQHQTEELDANGTAYSHMARLLPDLPESKVRSRLGQFNFSQDMANTEVRSLSGGEKARLLFALMGRHSPHILLLDEPTNHLDVDSREALVEALNDYKGAVILVSHDANLIELVCDRLWIVENGSCGTFDGDLDDYRKSLLESRRAARRQEKGNGTSANKRNARRDRAQARAANAELRKSVKKAEQRMEKLQTEQAKLEAQLADPEVYNGSTADLMKLQVRLGEIKSGVSSAEEKWLEASAMLEEAS